MSFTLPGIAWILERYDFDVIFIILAGSAALIFIAVLQLPKIAAITGVKTEPVE